MRVYQIGVKSVFMKHHDTETGNKEIGKETTGIPYNNDFYTYTHVTSVSRHEEAQIFIILHLVPNWSMQFLALKYTYMFGLKR